MPAKDGYHDTVKRALIKGGWAIEAEQVKLRIGNRRLWVDIQASHPDEDRIILIEVKGFENAASPVEALESAIGQYVVYQATLVARGLDIPFYLAVPDTAYFGIFEEALGQAVRQVVNVKLIVFEPLGEEVLTWVS